MIQNAKFFLIFSILLVRCEAYVLQFHANSDFSQMHSLQTINALTFKLKLRANRGGKVSKIFSDKNNSDCSENNYLLKVRKLSSIAFYVGSLSSFVPLNGEFNVYAMTASTSTISTVVPAKKSPTASSEINLSKKFGEELAIEAAKANKDSVKTRLDELNKDLSSTKSRLASLRNDCVKLITQAEKLEKKVEKQSDDSTAKQLALSEASNLRKEASKSKVQMVSLQNAILRESSEIDALQNRFKALDSFIQAKSTALTERKEFIENTKKQEEQKKSVKLAQDKAAAKAKAIANAKSSLASSKKDIGYADAALKINQAKLIQLSEALKKETAIEKKQADAVFVTESKLKKEREALMQEDKKLAALMNKVTSAEDEGKAAVESLAAKKAAYAAAADALKSLEASQ